MMQTQTQIQSQIKLNQRGLTELIVACAFLSLLTSFLWSWQVYGGVSAMEEGTTTSQGTLLPQIMHDRAIILCTVIAEFFVLLAVALAFVPARWWLRADHILDASPESATTPIQWLGQKIQHIGQAEPSKVQIGVNEAGEPIYYEQTKPGTHPFSLPSTQQAGAPAQPTGQPVPGQLLPGQPKPGYLIPGQPVPGQAQSGQPVPGQPVPGQAQSGQPVPGQPVPGQAQSGQPVPGQPVPPDTAPVNPVPPAQPASPAASPAPLSEVLNFEETPQDDPLADLANIGDILLSAFDEDMGIDPDMEALSRSLDDVEIETITKMTRQAIATLTQ